MRSTEYVANNIGISGFKYVLGSEISRLRRFVWLSIILLAFAWMIWNIQGRVSYFLSRPSAITTEMKFKNKIIFPKVTICNQNMFRSSKVYNETTGPRTSASLYEAIDRYLQVIQDDTGHESARQKVSEKYRELLSLKNVKEFYRRVAHQKNSLINRCIWKGRKCGPENFTEVFTNMGVCYQFNTNQDDMVVEKANKDGGLDLMLFVEQYDYMRGPQTSVGALVVISDQNETDILAKEQGIGVNVGQSVSIGLQKSEVIELPHPYGSCGITELENYSDDVPYTYQKCHLNCLTSFIKRKCGCVSIYMPGKDVPYCTLLENLQCVRPNEELFYRNNEIRTCDCRTPCHSASYMASLSLVQFSDSFKQSLVLSDRLVPITTVRTAHRIQVWGLLNTVNASITEGLAELGLMLIDYKTRWDRVWSVKDKVFEDVQHLRDFVSEHNLMTQVMSEMEPNQEAVKTWYQIRIAIMRISRTFEHIRSWILNLNPLTNFENMDYTMAITTLYNVHSRSYDWVENIGNNLEELIDTYNRYNGILFNFSSVATAHLQSLNISAVNDSVITELISAVSANGSSLTNDLSYLLSDISLFNGDIKEKSTTLSIQYTSDMDTVWKITNEMIEAISPGFYSANLLKLEIYFKDLGVQESKKLPAYSAEGLVCDIGGSIGLCLGGSILTLVEIFDIFAILFSSRKKLMTDSAITEKKPGS